MRYSLKKIKEDLKPLSKYEVVLFGSYVSGEFRVGSDINVAVITRKRDFNENVKILKGILGRVKPIYDVRIFELLPLKVKANVIDNYIVIFGDELEISEYFYYWRKFCEDFKYRLYYCKDYKEKLEAVRRGKRWIEIVEISGLD